MRFLRALPTIAAAASLLLSTACAADIYSAPAGKAVPGPALWVAADKDTTIYLFGTVHALPKDREWFDQRLQRAFDSADELVTEIDNSDTAASGQALAAAGTIEGGKTLRSLMKEDSRRKFEEALVSLGLPVEALDRTDPWFAAVTLSLLPLLRTGYSPENGVEAALAARAGDKTRDALETVQEQVDLFDKMPVDAQLAFLEETVAAVPRAGSSLDAMVAEWAEGDAAQLAALMNAEVANPALYDRLLVQRNARWAEWLDKRLDKPGTVFVAVGAGHLAGKDSVQDFLKRRGIKVRRVWQ